MGDQSQGQRFEEVVALIKERADLVGLVSKHTKLVKAPRGYKGCCPLHKEKTPSFYINVSGNYFYCYGCQKGGSVFDFLNYTEGLNFNDALKELASQLNIELPKSRFSRAETKEFKEEREAGFELLNRVANFYQRILKDSATPGADRALTYLKNRGIQDEEIAQLGLGWAPEDGATLIRKITAAPEKALAQKIDLIRNLDGKVFDSFRARLMIPIRDHKGRCTGFSGRTLEEGNPRIPKYKNSSESEWFKKKELLYGLDAAAKFIRAESFVCVVEGYFDQWAFMRRAIPAVAVMGTALTPEHLHLLGRHTKEVVLILDADAAGIAATKKSLPALLAADFNVKVFSQLGAKDPDEWLKESSESQEQIKLKLLNAPPALEWWMRLVLSEGQARGADRVESLRRLGELWSLAKSVAQRNVLADEVARLLGMTASDVKESLDAFAKTVQPQSSASTTRALPVQVVTPKMLAETLVDRHTRELLSWWLRHWDSLQPATEEEWGRREKLLEGTFAESFAKHLRTMKVRNKEALLAFVDAESTSPLLKNTLLRAFVPEEKSDIAEGLSPDKVLNSFEQLAEGLKHEKAVAELRQIQNKIRASVHDKEETERLLKRAQELMNPSKSS